MTKTKIVLFTFLLIVIGFVAFIFTYQAPPKPDSEVIIPTVTPTIKLETWNDPAGFIFQYPTGAIIDKHPDDQVNYANITLQYPDQTVEIVMSDDTYKNLDTWVGDKNAIDTSLGGKPAKKILTGGLTEIGCIDSDVIVTIKGKNISTIVDSWEFFYPTPTAKVKAPPSEPIDSGNILEEE